MDGTVEERVAGGVRRVDVLLRGCTRVHSSSSSFVEDLGGLPRRLGGDVVFEVDEEEASEEKVVFVADFVLGTSKVVFLGLPRFLGIADSTGVTLTTGFNLSIVTLSVLSPTCSLKCRLPRDRTL